MSSSFDPANRALHAGATVAFAVMLIAGCASHTPLSSTTGTTFVRTGTVIDVRDVDVRGGQSSGWASAVGTILGAAAGSTIGSGTGNALAAVGGAIAGGIAGQYASQQSNISKTVQVRVRMENGEEQVHQAESGSVFKVGDTVRVTTTNSGTQLSH